MASHEDPGLAPSPRLARPDPLGPVGPGRGGPLCRYPSRMGLLGRIKAMVWPEQSKWDVGRYDLRAELARMLAHPECRDVAEVPRVTLDRKPRKRQHSTSGYAQGGPLGPARIHLTLPSDCGPHEALAVLAHEVAHVAANPCEGHSLRWRQVYALLVRDLYGAKVPRGHVPWEELDLQIEQALRKVL